MYASSSSVYGSTLASFSAHESTEHPMSFYAATKKANELMAHSYSHLFGLPTTGLRLSRCTGRGAGRHGALLFTQAILAGKPIEIFGDGRMRRDYTYIDEWSRVSAPLRQARRPESRLERDEPDPRQPAPYRLYNIGNRSTWRSCG